MRANQFMKRTVRVGVRLGAVLGYAAIAAVSGCSSGEEAGGSVNIGATEPVAEVRGALDDNLTGLAYNNDCKNNKKVPLPPAWGKSHIKGLGGSGSTAWTSNGSFTSADSYFSDIGAGNIWYVTSSSPAGICVINAHDTGSGSGEFDVICQGTGGKACFWAGDQPSTPPSGSVNVIETSSTSVGLATHGANGDARANACPSCHAGENVFLTHYTLGQPLHATNLNGKTGWMPSAWYDPQVSTGSPQNRGPEAFGAYLPASTSGCTSSSCHAKGGLAGRFPDLTRPEVANGYCDILRQVTNRPGTAKDVPGGHVEGGGMPPGNDCTPNLTDPTLSNCAAQTDPFVKAMLDVCDGTAVSRANSPASLDAFGLGTTYNGFYDHAVVDKWSSGVHSVLLLDNSYNENTNTFGGWKETDYTGKLADTNFRTTSWLKGSGTEGSNFTIAATDFSGTIFESVGPNNRRDVTINASVLAAGSPSAYVRHDGYNTIVYRGVDNFIYESFWDSGSSQWFTNQLPGQQQQALGDPIGYNRGSSSSVIYKCGQASLCEERLVNGTWYWRTIGTQAGILPFVAVPIVSEYNGYEHTIFYTGSDGVHAIVDPCEPWYSCNLTDTLIYADPTVSSAAIPYNDMNGTSVVFITDGGGSNPSSLVQLSAQLNATSFTKTVLFTAQKSSETLVGDPTAYLAQGPYVNTILFRNSAGKLYQMQWSKSQNKYVKTTISL